MIILLGLLSAIGPFSIDMYLPGFPAIAENLNTSVDAVSYSLSSFFVGICLGQLICGPLLDRFGRKWPMYVGLIIYILASIGCAVSNTVEALIVYRFFQAIGGCVGMVAPRAIVRDVFPVHENAKVFSLLILVLGVSPIVAPTAGSFIISSLGWHAVFIVLAIVTAILLIAVIFFLKESRPADPSVSLRPKAIMNAFVRVMKDRQFFTYSVSGSLTAAGLFAYLAGSPFVFMNLFHVSEQQYGWIFAIIAIGLITSSQLNNLILKKYTSEQIILVALLVQTTAGILLLLGTSTGILGLYSTIALIFVFLSCQGFSFPNSSALSMAPFTKDAGSASALMGAIQMGFGAVASALVGLFSNGTAVPMTGVMAGCAILGLIVLFMGRRRIHYAKREVDVVEQEVDLIQKL